MAFAADAAVPTRRKPAMTEFAQLFAALVAAIVIGAVFSLFDADAAVASAPAGAGAVHSVLCGGGWCG
jgi:hypothetical protein